MTTLLYDIPFNEVAPNDPWVASVLASSTLPNQIGDLTSDNTLTTDDTIGTYLFTDGSGSIYDLLDAIILGIEGNLHQVPPPPPERMQAGLYGELMKVKGAVRSKFRITLKVFDEKIREIYPLTQLFITNPAQPGKHLRNPKVKTLTKQNYYEGMGGYTNTILALKRCLAEAMGYGAVMAHADFEQTTKHVVVGISDGFCNRGTNHELRELRATVKRLRRSEAWTFLFFFVADYYTLNAFKQTLFTPDTIRKAAALGWNSQVAREKVDAFLKLLIERRGYEDDTVPTGSGQKNSAMDKAYSQLMFETMGAGWASYVENEADITGLTGPAGDTARIYLLAEKAIEEMLGSSPTNSYKAQGGFAFPADNINTIFFEPDALAKMLGQEVSSSVIRASVALNAQPASASINPPPSAQPGAPDPDSDDDIF